MLNLHNTISGRKEPFTPLESGKASYYSCGPTVYNYVHIGNLRTYIFTDILRRTLLAHGYDVTHVMNITDVGHLTSDADAGEDKMMLSVAREGKTAWEIADFYTAAFKENIADLNILEPSIWCKATDHIPEQIALIQQLEKRGFAYVAGGNVYFDTARFPAYGALTRRSSVGEAVNRVDEDPQKRNSADFALWFTKSKFGEQDMRWESPWGVGYPGWHIECSAMSVRYLGQPFDIHSGGIDHIPVHHTNEIAQSEAATGIPLARYWLHGEFLVLDTKRMGKSEGNFITLATLKEKCIDPLAYRYFTTSAHYRQQLTFTWDALAAAAEGYRNLCATVSRIRLKSEGGDHAQASFAVPHCTVFKKEFMDAVDDDLNIPQALARLHEFTAQVNRTGETFTPHDHAAILKSILDADKIFGLRLDERSQRQALPQKIEVLLTDRSRARSEQRWSDADTIRKKIEDAGYRIEDNGDDSTAFPNN